MNGRRWLALGLALFPAAAIAGLRANYEVSLSADGSVHGARRSVAVSSGVAIVDEFKPVNVRLVPRLDTAGGYELDVQLAAKVRDADDVGSVATRSFQGRLGTPLEFEANFEGWVVSGAIVVHESHDGAR